MSFASFEVVILLLFFSSLQQKTS